MLLRYSLGDEKNAGRIERGIEIAFHDGARTVDLAAYGAPALNTLQFTNQVIERL
jgi:isocitrate dehydrogenase